MDEDEVNENEQAQENVTSEDTDDTSTNPITDESVTAQSSEARTDTSDTGKVDGDGFPVVDASEPAISEDEVSTESSDEAEKSRLAKIEEEFKVKRLYSGEKWMGWNAIITTDKGDYKISIVKPKIGAFFRARSAYSYTDEKGNSHFEDDKLINMMLKQTAIIDPDGKNLGRNLNLDSFDSFDFAGKIIRLISFCLASFQNS